MQITAENVTKRYGEVTALDSLSMEIPAGTTFGLLGTNGAGKTTLFTLLVGLDRPDSGRLTVGQQDVAETGIDIREQVGYLPEHVGFPAALTGREVLQFHAKMRGLPRDGRIGDVIDTVGLSQSDADRQVDGYSNGMCRRLGLAAAILPEPGVLLLDEPTAGLDPQGVARFHDIIERVRERTGVTVVVSSHALAEIERLSDHVAVLNDGRLRESGPVTELTGGQKTMVELQPADPEKVDSLATNLADLTESVEGLEPPAVADGTVSARCPPAAVPELFAALDDGPRLVDTTVESSGLDAVFQRAVEDSQSGDREKPTPSEPREVSA